MDRAKAKQIAEQVLAITRSEMAQANMGIFERIQHLGRAIEISRTRTLLDHYRDDVRSIFVHCLSNDMDVEDAIKMSFDSADAIESETSARYAMKVAEMERMRKAAEKAAAESQPDMTRKPEAVETQGEGAGESESGVDGEEQARS